MGFVFDEDTLAALPAGTPARGGEPTGLVENFNAAYDSFSRLNRFDSKRIGLKKEWEPIVANINKKTGKEFKNPVNNRGTPQQSLLPPEKTYDIFSEEILNFVNDNQDMFPEYQGLDKDKILENAKKQAIKSEEVAQEIAEYQSLPGLIGEFTGYAASAITDIPNVIFTAGDLAITKGALTRARLAESTGSVIAKQAFREALVGAGSEAVVQTEVSKWYKELGLPYDYKTFLANVGIAGVGAGVLTAGVMGAKPAYQLTKEQMIKGAEVLNKAKAKITGTEYVPDETLAMIRESSEVDNVINSQNVLPEDAGHLEHNANIENAIDAIETGDYTKIIPEGIELEKQAAKEFNEDDLIRYDGPDAQGTIEQTDILLRELQDNIDIQGEEFLAKSVPVDKFDAATGETVQSAMTIREIVDELEQDKKMVDRLTGCLT